VDVCATRFGRLAVSHSQFFLNLIIRC
jgi:hypothetical protein